MHVFFGLYILKLNNGVAWTHDIITGAKCAATSSITEQGLSNGNSDPIRLSSFQKGQRSGLCALTRPSGSPCSNTTVTWHYTMAMWHICQRMALSKYLSNSKVFVWEKSCQNVLNLQGQEEEEEGKLLPQWQFFLLVSSFTKLFTVTKIILRK